MNTASDSRYEVMASFRVSGLVPISAAIAGSEVAITVESMFSMNRAVATMSGIRRSLVIEIRGAGGRGAQQRLYHRIAGPAIAEPAKPPKSCVTMSAARLGRRRSAMIYILAALLPPLGLLLNGQPFSAIFNLFLIVFCVIFGLVFHVLLLVPSAHALIAVYMKREERRHREVVEAIRQHGPPPGYQR